MCVFLFHVLDKTSIALLYLTYKLTFVLEKREACSRKNDKKTTSDKKGDRMSKIIKNWLVVFVVLFIWSFIWHNIILGGFYTVNLAQIGRYDGDTVAALMGFLALGNLIATFGFAKFLPSASKGIGQFVTNGIIMGIITFGSFAVISHAIFWGWTSPLMIADFSYSIFAGAIGGLLTHYLS
jgi:hypothetical protein